MTCLSIFFSQLYAAEKRFQDKENDLLAYKEQQFTKPEVKLESENNLLRMEKVRQGQVNVTMDMTAVYQASWATLTLLIRPLDQTLC